jgi:hypothetical protein
MYSVAIRLSVGGGIFDNRIILRRLAVEISSGLTKPDFPGEKSFKLTSFGYQKN